MDWIGNMMASWIEAVGEQDRLAVAIILILWVSALASSFIDNIPFTTAMVSSGSGLVPYLITSL